jgi:predicted small secreted protein
MKRTGLFIFVILLAAVLLAGWLLLAQPAEPVQELGTTHFSGMSISGNLAVGTDTTLTGDLDVGGDASVTGSTTLSGLLLPSSTTITPTAGQSITPAYELYIIGSSGAVSMTLAACSNNGQQVWFYGEDANTITVNDSNIRSTDGNAVTFGQYDVVGFMCAKTEWNHIAKSANQ